MLSSIVDSLIKESERIYLAREKAIIPGQDYIRRHFWYPALMVSKGFDFAKKEFLIYSVVYALLVFLTFILVKEIPSEYPPEVVRAISSVSLYGVIFAPFFVALFLPPSTYTGSRINKTCISQLLEMIPREHTNGLEELLTIHQYMAEKRILFLKRLYALSWAAFLYMIKHFEKLEGIEQGSMESELLGLSLYSAVLILGFLFIQAYSKSTETILASVKVAIVERRIG